MLSGKNGCTLLLFNGALGVAFGKFIFLSVLINCLI